MKQPLAEAAREAANKAARSSRRAGKTRNFFRYLMLTSGHTDAQIDELEREIFDSPVPDCYNVDSQGDEK